MYCFGTTKAFQWDLGSGFNIWFPIGLKKTIWNGFLSSPHQLGFALKALSDDNRRSPAWASFLIDFKTCSPPDW